MMPDEYLNTAYDYISGKDVDYRKIVKEISNYTFCDNGDPVLFFFAIDIKIFKLLEEYKIDFLQVSRNTKCNLLMHADEHMSLNSFGYLANIFHSLGSIDTPNANGMSALSGYIKLGELDRARILLEFGASVSNIAKIQRYGGSELTVPMQALYSSSRDGQSGKIKALKLLKEFGYSPLYEEKCKLVETANSMNFKEVKNWIEMNL